MTESRKIRIYYHDSVTDERRQRVVTDYSREDKGTAYYYAIGNFGCDCNRSNEMYGTYHERSDQECSKGQSVIRVERIETEDGRLICDDQTLLNGTMADRLEAWDALQYAES